MYIVDGHVVDTYGGDYTYQYVYAEEGKDGLVFFEYCTGAKEHDSFQVDDPADIAEYTEIYKEMKEKALS